MAIMPLKKVLDGQKGQKELSTILGTAKKTIMNDLQSKKSKANLLTLEQNLNDIFYPMETPEFTTDAYRELHRISMEEDLVKRLETFDFEKAAGSNSQKAAMSPATLQASLTFAKHSLMSTLKNLSS
jgi:hypothetical protein